MLIEYDGPMCGKWVWFSSASTILRGGLEAKFLSWLSEESPYLLYISEHRGLADADASKLQIAACVGQQQQEEETLCEMSQLKSKW